MSGDQLPDADKPRTTVATSGNDGDGFDPAAPSELDVRSATRIKVVATYQKLVEEGHHEAAEDLRNTPERRMGGRAGTLRREFLPDWNPITYDLDLD